MSNHGESNLNKYNEINKQVSKSHVFASMSLQTSTVGWNHQFFNSIKLNATLNM